MKLTTDDRAALQGAVRVLVEILQQVSPEVPERVEVWPENDEHLRGEFWQDEDGDLWAYRNGLWRVWSPEKRTWDTLPGVSLAVFSPFTRTTDPSQPRRFDSLADIPEDTERVAGKYQSYPCELARSPLSGTGWMMQVDAPYVTQQWVEYRDLDEDNLTDIEEVIDHE